MKELKLFEVIKNNLLTSGQDGRLNALLASSHNRIKIITKYRTTITKNHLRASRTDL